MRIAVYGIAKNEARHVARFLHAVADADLVCILDTGSTDETVALFRAGGANVRQQAITPWRFDSARNAALELVPDAVDVCVSLDIDEVLAPGWRAALEAAWQGDVKRIGYPLVCTHPPDGSPGVWFVTNRVHARHGFRWRWPIHEALEYVGPGEDRAVYVPNFVVHHWPDESRHRSAYLPLLRQAVAEDPTCDRMAFYLGRELFFAGVFRDAIAELQRFLALPGATDRAQRCEALRLVAGCCRGLGVVADEIAALWRAVGECGAHREAWSDLALALYLTGQESQAYAAARCAVSLPLGPSPCVSHWPPRPACPHDVLSVTAWDLGLRPEARHHAELAAKLDPANERLRANAAFFQGAA